MIRSLGSLGQKIYVDTGYIIYADTAYTDTHSLNVVLCI